MPHAAALAGFVLLYTFSQEPGFEGSMPRVELRVYRHATLSAAGLARAGDTVNAIFAPAAFALSWVDCDRDVARCGATTSPQVTVDVLVLPGGRRGRPGVCGETASSPSNGASIVVFVSCVRSVVGELRRSSKDPRLLTLQPADLIGLTIAHELGHVWGLRHGPRGLMIAQFDRDALLALLSGPPELTPNQLATITEGIRRLLPPGSPALAAR